MVSPEVGEHGPDDDRHAHKRVIGPFDAVHIVTEKDARRADAALRRLVRRDTVEREMLRQSTVAAPLADVAGFSDKHRAFVRAIENYDRNGRRKATRLPGGLLRPVVTPVVAVMTAVMAKAYQKRVLTDVRRLYVMREANSAVGSPEHRQLTTARRQLDAMIPDLVSKGFAVPAFLLGGAALSAAASVVSDLLHNDLGRLGVLAVVLALTVGAFWCILMAAAVTRRRARLVLDQPLGQLWRSIGGAGRPPRDPSRAFVAVATILLLVGWVVTPVAVVLISGWLL